MRADGEHIQRAPGPRVLLDALRGPAWPKTGFSAPRNPGGDYGPHLPLLTGGGGGGMMVDDDVGRAGTRHGGRSPQPTASSSSSSSSNSRGREPSQERALFPLLAPRRKASSSKPMAGQKENINDALDLPSSRPRRVSRAHPCFLFRAHLPCDHPCLGQTCFYPATRRAHHHHHLAQKRTGPAPPESGRLLAGGLSKGVLSCGSG